MNDLHARPLVALTMGDVAGIGPEVIVKGWADPRLHALARPLVVGDPGAIETACALLGTHCSLRIHTLERPEQADPSPCVIPCLRVADLPRDLADVTAGRVDARAGRAAYQFLTAAAGLAMAGEIDAITTLPLNKLALHQAGVVHPGHTEILAEYCNVPEHAMMLYLENDKPRGARSRCENACALAVASASCTSPCTSRSSRSST